MEVDFQLLVRKIRNGDKPALEQFIVTCSIIARNRARKERRELKWIAGPDGKITGYTNLVENVIRKLIFGSQEFASVYMSLNDFKRFFTDEFGRELGTGFSEFLKLLKNKQNPAWKIVFKDLESRSAAWFYKKTGAYKEEFNSIFCESMETVYLNLLRNELYFNDSCAFKSYFFKILENKYHESAKNPYLAKAVSIDSINFSQISDHEGERDLELTEQRFIIEKALNQLSEGERYILTEYFYADKQLKYIASETGQSEENIRIKKYRALKKLFGLFKTAGYGAR